MRIKLTRLEDVKIPADFDYDKIKSMSNKTKNLSKIRLLLYRKLQESVGFHQVMFLYC
jgi:tRNA U34 5-carboxymethylaminomethyl modifying enzyme MnmG/GidA